MHQSGLVETEVKDIDLNAKEVSNLFSEPNLFSELK